MGRTGRRTTPRTHVGGQSWQQRARASGPHLRGLHQGPLHLTLFPILLFLIWKRPQPHSLDRTRLPEWPQWTAPHTWWGCIFQEGLPRPGSRQLKPPAGTSAWGPLSPALEQQARQGAEGRTWPSPRLVAVQRARYWLQASGSPRPPLGPCSASH